jgi:phosphoglycolate phosphatase-like HAD superfamily hydrolase
MRNAVVFDVDGTLCDVSSVRHHVIPTPTKRYKDFHKFHAEAVSCPPHEHVAEAARVAHAAGLAVLVVTARSSEWMEHTVWWLLLNDIPFDQMYMREKGDGRKDFLVKSEILALIRADGFNPVHAWDDNPNVLELWKQQRIPTTVVAGWVEED